MVKRDQPPGRPARRPFDDITYWCSCTLPEAVQLQLDRRKWGRITGLNSPHGGNDDDDYDHMIIYPFTTSVTASIETVLTTLYLRRPRRSLGQSYDGWPRSPQ